MAQTTVAKMLYRLSHMMDDMSQSGPRHDLPSKLDALDRAMFIVSSKLPGRATQNTSFISLAADDFDYTISETDLTTLGPFRRASDGEEVFRVSVGAIMRYRQGATVEKGDPVLIAFEEAASGSTTAYVWPTPVRSDTLQALRTVALTSVFQGLASTDLTATSLSFGPYGTLAMEYIAAIELEPGHPRAEVWGVAAADLIRREQYRINRMQSGSGQAVMLNG